MDAAVPNPAAALAAAKLATVPFNPPRGWAPDGNEVAAPLRSSGSSDRIRARNPVKQHLRERAPKGGSEMDAHVGDSIVLESERVGQPAHSGVVEEVLQGQ